MYIWSIDVGHRNMGLAVLEIPDDAMPGLLAALAKKGPRRSAGGEQAPARKKRRVNDPAAAAHAFVLGWKDVRICLRETVSAWPEEVRSVNRRSVQEICHRVGDLLEDLVARRHAGTPPRAVLVEQQPVRAQKNRALECYIEGFFRGRGVPLVAQVSSKLKMTELVLRQASFHPGFAECPTPEQAETFTYAQRKRAAVAAAACWCTFLGYTSACASEHGPDDGDALLQALAILATFAEPQLQRTSV